MGFPYYNFQSGTITDNPLLIGATTINSAAFANLPEIAGDDRLYLVLDPDGSAGTPEVVLVTAHGAAATSVTVTRGQQTSMGGGAARQHLLGEAWTLAATAQDLRYLPQQLLTSKGDLVTASAVNTPVRQAVGTNEQVLIADSAQTNGIKWGQIATAGITDKAVTGPKMLPALCQVRMSAAQSIPNGANTTLSFDTEDLDALTWHAGGTPTRITPTIAGWYRVTFTTDWQSDTDYFRLLVNILKNGAVTTPLRSIEIPGGAVTLTPNVSGSVTLVQMNGTTDFLELSAFQVNTSAGANTCDATFLVELVYPT